MGESLMNFLAGIGLVTIMVIFAYFLTFCFGLARVFHQAGVPRWKAFVPAFNFMFLVDLIGLPRVFFWMSLVPYFGTLYAFAVMNRLAEAYDRNIVFTSVWLTFAAAIGLHILPYHRKLDSAVFEKPAPSLDTVKASIRRHRASKV